jgi:ABC-type multidrug transport system fused ATPase/permease subunit
MSLSYRAQIADIGTMSFGSKMRVLGRVLAFSAPYKRFLSLLFLLTLIEVALTKIEPFLAQFIIDDVLVQRDGGLLNIVFGAMVGLFLVRSFYAWIVHYISYYLNSRVNFDVRKRFFQHIQQQSLRFFMENPAAEIAHTESVNLPAMQRFLIGSLDELSNHVLQLLTGILLLLLMDWKLALLSLMSLPLWVLGTVYFSNKMAPVGQAMNIQDVRMKRRLGETINGIEVIQSYNREPYERKRYFGELSRSAFLGIDQMLWGTGFSTAIGSISAIGTAFVFWFGGHQIIRGEMTIGQLIAFNMLLAGLFAPLSMILQYLQQANDITVAALQVFAYWDLKPEIMNAPDALALRNVQGNIEFVDVTFGYEPEEPVLQDLSFEILPGQMVAFCGPSGSGKSTIAKLLLRFYDPLGGEVFVDGFNLKDLELGSYRSAVGLVSQRPFLFEDSIANNIRYGRLDATPEDIQRAARQAQADDFIQKLPEGYETRLGSGGTGLSGGQLQRLAIARALLADPRILILDEATSALDTETERAIQDALEILLEGRTAVVIAHRLSTIVHADRIYVIKGGRIVEQGTHADLLARGGEFHALWQQQLGEE